LGSLEVFILAIGNWQLEIKRMSENQENISESASAPEAVAAPPAASQSRANRSQKVGTVTSDKMQKTVVVRVDRLVRHRKYRRYVRRTSKFMAHDEMGATIGDKVRIVETRPLSARKRWRVIEIVQKAAK
jgi:small subunit ribosomal protein S17